MSDIDELSKLRNMDHGSMLKRSYFWGVLDTLKAMETPENKKKVDAMRKHILRQSFSNSDKLNG